MNKVTIISNPFEHASKYKTHEVGNVIEFLQTQFSRFPDTAKIFHHRILPEHDVTPKNDEEIHLLERMEGDFYVVLYPGDPFNLAYTFYYLVAIAAIVAVATLKPKIPDIPAARNYAAGSPNNELSARTNKARINGRIPDIFGEQISTPDLMSLPYSVYINHREVEYAYMCIGRGAYEILDNGHGKYDVKDGDTRISEIDEASVAIYPPFTSPNQDTHPLPSDVAQLVIGKPINEFIFNVQKLEAVNGQTLKASNEDTKIITVREGSDITYVYPNRIEINLNGTRHIGFTDLGFVPGDQLLIVVDSSYFFNPSGTYTVASVLTNDTITLVSPELVNPIWTSTSGAYFGVPTVITKVTTGFDITNWIGPFVIDMPGMTNFISNFVCPQGLYADDGNVQTAIDVFVEVEITPVNAAGIATGSARSISLNITGSASDQSEKAGTLRSDHYASGHLVPLDLTPSRYSVRARRVSPKDLDFTGRTVDEVKWKAFYGTTLVDKAHFGDITTIQSKTVATTGALAVKERKLNVRVIRKIKTYIATETTHGYSPTLEPTKKASDILVHCLKDTKIGNRTNDEIQFFQIQETLAQVQSYFGSSKCIEFNYTFDKANVSPEETIQAIANAAFCDAFRRGNVITLNFEKLNPPTRLAFNHANKLPNTEKRTFTFGKQNNFDGLEYEYVAELDQAPLVYYIPLDRTAVNPKKVASIGVRTGLQAYFHAWRLWQRMTKQRIAVDFDALQEAELLLINEKILVADNTRSGTQDGLITDKTGLVLTTSQPVEFDFGVDYVVFLQLTDGTVQAISATAGASIYEITLGEEPLIALSLNPSNYALASYILAKEDNTDVLEFLVSEKSPGGPFTFNLKAVNYTPEYYVKDNDLIDAVIDANGVIL